MLDGEDFCLGSNISPTVVLGECDSGATNDILDTGCSVSDFLGVCEPLRSCGNGAYVACVALTSVLFKHQGVITGGEAGAITSCAARNH